MNIVLLGAMAKEFDQAVNQGVSQQIHSDRNKNEVQQLLWCFIFLKQVSTLFTSGTSCGYLFKLQNKYPPHAVVITWDGDCVCAQTGDVFVAKSSGQLSVKLCIYFFW